VGTNFDAVSGISKVTGTNVMQGRLYQQSTKDNPLQVAEEEKTRVTECSLCCSVELTNPPGSLNVTWPEMGRPMVVV
jgi:hypothetical protein